MCLSGISPGIFFAGATIFANNNLDWPLPVICTTGEPDNIVDEYAIGLQLESMTDSHSLTAQAVVQFAVFTAYFGEAFAFCAGVVLWTLDSGVITGDFGIRRILPPIIRSSASLTPSTCFINQQL